MVDQDRVDRLLDRIGLDVAALATLRDHRVGDEREADDPTVLAAVKYRFVTAIEGCARVAHHIVVSEGWRVAETNADAIRTLGKQGVLTPATAEPVARAVGFRNILVHEYIDVDDEQVVHNLGHLGDLERFVAEVSAWLETQP